MFFDLFRKFWLFSLIMPVSFYVDGEGEGGGSGGGEGESGEGSGDGGAGEGDQGAGGSGGEGEGSGSGEGAGAFDNWFENIDEKYATDPSISRHKDQPINEIFKSLINAKAMVGKDKVALPGENATPEEIDAFHKAIGRPEVEDGYDLQAPDDIPEGMRYSETFAKNFMKAAFDAGVPKGMAQKQWAVMAKASMDLQARANADVKAKSEEAVRALKNEWGSAYDQKIAMGKKAAAVISKATGTKFSEFLEANDIQSDPMIAKVLSFMGDQFSEDQIGEASGDVAMTNREAKAEINVLKADPSYTDAKHPKHTDTVEKLTKLYEIAYKD